MVNYMYVCLREKLNDNCIMYIFTVQGIQRMYIWYMIRCALEKFREYVNRITYFSRN